MKHLFKLALPLLNILLISTVAKAQYVSDKKLKQNQKPIVNGLNYINQLQPLTFEFDQSTYKRLNLPAGTQYGFIADDVKGILPTLVTTENKWYEGGKSAPKTVETSTVDMLKMIPILVSAIKEQQAEINRLKDELEKLKAATK